MEPGQQSNRKRAVRQDVSREPERWIPIDRNLTASASWTIRPLPPLIAEPVEEEQAPVQEVAEPSESVAPKVARAPAAPRTETVPVRVARRRRRFSPHLATSLMVVLLAGGLGAGVTVILWPDAGSVERAQPPPRVDGAKSGDAAKAAPKHGGGDPVVVAAGDIACDPSASTFEDGFGTPKRCRQAYTADLVQKLEPDAVLVLGDIQYEDGQYRKYMMSYDPTWGRFKQISYPTPATKHDRFGEGGYRRYWGARAGPQGSHWYSIDIGDWHVVSLNSNCRRVGSCDPGSPQERWLRADLAANRAPCTLAFWHEPRFSSSKEAALKMKPIWQALSHFGAELVLSGDAHNYERFRPQDAAGRLDRRRGIRQFVVGTGGKSLVRFQKRSAGSVVQNGTTFGVLRLTLHPTRYDWQFVPEPESPFIDTGSAACH
jgi:acid phosphatase type 7